MLNYDREAAHYDETRGGEPRGEAAAAAIAELLPAGAATLLDVACGTGIVTGHISRPGLTVFGADLSAGMARYAATRLEGRVLLANCTALPIATGSLDAVSAIWLLHLIDHVPAMMAEAARVLRPGGTVILTVEKDASHNAEDIGELTLSYRRKEASDDFAAVRDCGARLGLAYAGETAFIGHGQGRTPRKTADAVRSGYFRSALALRDGDADTLAASLDALPAPQERRPDPIYRLIALRRG